VDKKLQARFQEAVQEVRRDCWHANLCRLQAPARAVSAADTRHATRLDIWCSACRLTRDLLVQAVTALEAPPPSQLGVETASDEDDAPVRIYTRCLTRALL